MALSLSQSSISLMKDYTNSMLLIGMEMRLLPYRYISQLMVCCFSIRTYIASTITVHHDTSNILFSYMCYLESSFGQLIDSTTYISLTESSILTTNTTLYCVAEDITSPQVVWSYTDSSDATTILPAVSNDVTTGISTLNVYSNNPGYYSCEVITYTGIVRIHRVRMLDTTLYTGK